MWRISIALLLACRTVVAGNDGGDAPVDGSSNQACVAWAKNEPPAAPSIAAPGAGRIDVVAAGLVVGTSAFADADPGDTQAAADLEIWTMEGGERDQRVWHAHLADPARLTKATLADGEFDGGEGARLRDWADYAVRARVKDASGACNAWSAWGPDRIFRTDDGSSHLFDPTRVHRIDLTIPPESWNAINAEAIPPGGCTVFRRAYHRGTLSFEDQTFDDVGIRVKGGCGSARDLARKAAFKVSLSWDDPDVPGCPEERRLFGLEHLTLNNAVQDPTLEHERLGYAIYQRMGVATPRATHADLYVNGEYWGVYVWVETIDRRFLSRWFDDNDGMLYEGAYWCDLVAANVPADEYSPSCFTKEFEVGACDTPDDDADPTDFSLLRELVAKIAALPPGGFYPEIGAFFDYDELLSEWAVSGIIAHWDAYDFSIINNYRVYHDPSADRWSIIPTGIDQTFAGDPWSGTDLDPFLVAAVLATRCLEEADCAAAFAARLAQVADVFEEMDLAAEAERIHALILPHVAADPRREFDLPTWDWLHQQLLAWIAGRPGIVRGILAAHGY
ncbi:MAG: CotH kinase family protein [Myxococcota bacterium]